VSAYESKAVWAKAELELSNARCAEVVAWEDAKRKKVVDLKKAMEVLRLENSALEAKKVFLKDELLTQQGNIVLMLG